MITCKELRQRARNSLDNKIFGKTWLLMIVVTLITGAVSSAAAAVGSIIPVIGTSIAPMIVAGPMAVGTAVYLLNVVYNRKDKNNLVTLFLSFKNGKTYVAYILQSVYVFLWSLLFVVPGIVKSYSYSLTYYIMAENPDMTANEAITESRRLMDGYKMKMFLLDLSFIGWMIVGCLTCGIAMIWVGPYMSAAKAELYKEIKASK